MLRHQPAETRKAAAKRPARISAERAEQTRREEHVAVCTRLAKLQTKIDLVDAHLMGLIGAVGEIGQRVETTRIQLHDVLRVRAPDRDPEA